MMKKVILLTGIAMFASSSWAQTGEQVYQKSCQICHASGVAGAPKLGDKTAWKTRLDKGMPALIKSIKNGKGAMPPGGMCTDCKESDYKAAIQYMSKK